MKKKSAICLAVMLTMPLYMGFKDNETTENTQSQSSAKKIETAANETAPEQNEPFSANTGLQ